MRLPRRVPWSNPAELEELCSWIYADVDELPSKILAINRLSAWKASTTLPHALDSTLSLLIVILQDENTFPSTTHSPPLVLRQSYALALIRLVNGLVDPLQQGAFARSIASIASQIGLPLWLVELRHASTHEELPSMELLREGARDAMSWLLHNYFLPTLSPVNHPASMPILSPLSPLLAQYKRLLKMTARDASLKSRFKPELVRILREVQRWIAEAKVAVSMANLGTQYSEEDERDKWALDRLCDVLLGRGGLVPISKRKRPSPSHLLTAPTPQAESLWSPLIFDVHSRYPTFPSILLSRLIGHLILPAEGQEKAALEFKTTERGVVDASYDHTLASWALWIVQRWGDDISPEYDRTNVLREILVGLRRSDSRAARALVIALVEHDTFLHETVALLTATIQSSSRVSRWEDNSLETMSSRLSSLVQDDVRSPESRDQDVEMSILRSTTSGTETSQPVNGWKLLKEEGGWKPCPIGVFIPSLA